MSDVKKDRRNFIKKSVAGLAGVSILPSVLTGGGPDQKPKKQKMIYRTLGKTGIKVPIVSMGVMNADNPKLVQAALEAGILHLDTAHVYQRGRNETMIGEAVKGIPRKSFVLATKVVPTGTDRATKLYTERTSAADFIEKFETSLKRLQMDYVDILYLHSAKNRQNVLFEPLLNAMVKLKKQGKTRFIGVSTHHSEPEVIRAVVESKVLDVVLTAYNFKKDNLEELNKAIDAAAKAGIGIVAMKTQAGVYWDKEKQQPINMKAALKWALQNPNIHTSIPGFNTFDQMELDLSVMADLTLTAQEKADLKPGKQLGFNGLYCQQCDTCVGQCGRDFDIPTLMRGYMYAYGYKNMSLAKDTVNSVKLAGVSGALPCTGCSTCSVKCPMGFDVRRKIMDIARIKEVPEEFLV